MIPNDRMILGEEGIFYRDHLKDLARQGVPSSEMPSFKDWQNGELERIVKRENTVPKSKHVVIKLIAFGLAAYLVWQAYNYFSNYKYLNKEHSTQDNFLNEAYATNQRIKQ